MHDKTIAVPPSPADAGPDSADNAVTRAPTRPACSPSVTHDDVLVTPPADDRTSRARLGWQLRASRVLADVLALAVRDALPRIAWTVGDAGATLAGCCYGRTVEERRIQFAAWCAAVGATVRPELTGSGGAIYLRAVVARYDGLVDLIVLADLYPDEDEVGDA